MIQYQNYKLYDSYDDAISHALVVNKRELFQSFCFEVPHQLTQSLSLLCIRDSVSGEVVDDNAIDDKFPFPWIDVNTSALNQEIGNHVYVFTFMNNIVDHTVDLYASYIIRYNDPDKPYIYMKRSEENA